MSLHSKLIVFRLAVTIFLSIHLGSYLSAQEVSQEVLDMTFLGVIYDGDKGGVVRLMELGASVNARDSNGITALMYAMMGDDFDIIGILIYNGAELNAVDNSGMNVMMHAIRAGKGELVKFILPSFNQINHQDNEGNTAMIISAEMDEFELMEALFSAGADIHLQTKKGTNALMHAAAFGSFYPLDFLAFYGLDVNHQAEDGSTAMHLAAYYGHSEIIGLLLDWGADIEIRDKQGNTPLMVAIMANQVESCWYLMESGASPVVVNQKGFSPLSLASLKGYSRISELLLYYDFVEPAQDDKNLSALAHAYYVRNRKQQKQLRTITGVRPRGLYFSEFWVKQGFDFNQNDLMYHSGIGFYEARFRMVATLNFNTRIGRRSLLVPQSNDFLYQFHEKRHVFSLGLYREYMLFRITNNLHVGLLPGVEFSYSLANYRGTAIDPPYGFDLAPVLGLYIHDRNFSLFGAYNYLDTKQQGIDPSRFRAGVIFRFGLIRTRQFSYSPVLR